MEDCSGGVCVRWRTVVVVSVLMEDCSGGVCVRWRTVVLVSVQGMIALRREATELNHEDYMDAIMEVQAKKKANLNYYA